VKAHQAVYPIRTMCRLLELSPSGYYAWRRRGPSKRELSDQALLERIRAIHAMSDGTYGALRIQAELADEGTRVNRKRIARLMRESSLRGVCRRRFVITTVRGTDAPATPDLVKRNFKVEGPDQLWVADITYIPTWAGFLYLAVVLDAWSRRIIGWSMQASLATELVLDALNMAIAKRRPQDVVHHSDHGCQYTSLAFGQRCREMGVRPSLGSVGDAYDNAMCESFFATLECELLDRRTFQNQREARHAVFGFIEGWYNPKRRHSALDYMSPVSYENKYLLSQSLPVH
jgi:putative transposase